MRKAAFLLISEKLPFEVFAEAVNLDFTNSVEAANGDLVWMVFPRNCISIQVESIAQIIGEHLRTKL